jgi:hypothetical protein
MKNTKTYLTLIVALMVLVIYQKQTLSTQKHNEVVSVTNALATGQDQHDELSSQDLDLATMPPQDQTDSEKAEPTLTQKEKWARTFDLSQKVLPSMDEKKELQTLLADTQLIGASFDSLTQVQNVNLDNLEENQKERMDAALFLTRAMEWQDNPALHALLEQATQFIVDDNLSGISEPAIKRSFAADKVELFANLKEIYHAQGLEIEDLNTSEQNAKLFRFANHFYQLDLPKGN